MFVRQLMATAFLAAGIAAAQEPAPLQASGELPKAEPAKSADYVIESGTRVPLSLINSISTKHSAEGDRQQVAPCYFVSRRDYHQWQGVDFVQDGRILAWSACAAHGD